MPWTKTHAGDQFYVWSRAGALAWFSGSRPRAPGPKARGPGPRANNVVTPCWSRNVGRGPGSGPRFAGLGPGTRASKVVTPRWSRAGAPARISPGPRPGPRARGPGPGLVARGPGPQARGTGPGLRPWPAIWSLHAGCTVFELVLSFKKAHCSL